MIVPDDWMPGSWGLHRAAVACTARASNKHENELEFVVTPLGRSLVLLDRGNCPSVASSTARAPPLACRLRFLCFVAQDAIAQSRPLIVSPMSSRTQRGLVLDLPLPALCALSSFVAIIIN